MTKREKESVKNEEILVKGLVVYDASELEERRKNDWKQSKEIVSKIFTRKAGAKL